MWSIDSASESERVQFTPVYTVQEKEKGRARGFGCMCVCVCVCEKDAIRVKHILTERIVVRNQFKFENCLKSKFVLILQKLVEFWAI